jgi:diguanylate cyclase (GGDEF)-like protein/PAS domain S-box-containing protein
MKININKNNDRYDSISKEIAYDIVESSNVVIFDWTTDVDLPTNFVSINISQFGYTPEDFYSGKLMDYWEFVYIEDRERVKNTIYKIRKTKALKFRHSYRIITNMNTIRWVEERIIFERDENNDIISETGIVIDINEIKELEHELKKSKIKYESIFENSSAVIIILDSKGKIINANKKFAKVLGYSKKETKKMYIWEIIEENEFAKIESEKSNFSNYIRYNINKSVEIKAICKNGNIKFFSCSIDLLKDKNVLINVEIVAIDITERKKDEEKINYLINHDILTDLYNRAFYEKELKKIKQINNYPYSIIVGDVNGLKEVNDMLGHKEGDLLLKKIALIMKESCRNTDIIARIGGDEFAIICPNTTTEKAQLICDRISKLCILESENQLIKPSIALGFATEYFKKNETRDIFKEADSKMYKNKSTFAKSSRSSFLVAQQAMLEGKSFETRQHITDIKNYVLKLGNYLNFTKDKLDLLSLTALMHDIGKVSVPSKILLKNGKLSDEEYEIIKQHSLMGYNILKTLTTTKEIGKYVLYHHECWDGTGYPNNLKGEEIPLISRIVSIVDAYVVMIDGRPYKKKKSKIEAINELKICSGTQFDPELTNIFIEIIESE